MNRTSLYFVAPRQVELRTEPLPAGQPGQVLVRTLLSAISPGTEMLIYRGQAPQNLAADDTIQDLSGTLAYPLKYGYSLVGEVIDGVGEQAKAWIGRRVFAFHPHETHFWTHPQHLHPLPESLALEDAVFLPNMETAVNFVQDAAPLLGEQCVIFGQGVVGLLTMALLGTMPLAQRLAFDPLPLRRELSLSLGADVALDPTQPQVWEEARARLQAHAPDGRADLVLELSGSPQALQQAIDLTGFGGRIIIGSWYGEKPVSLNLGGRFHRDRIQLISSQVSTLAPALRGRWTKARRLQVAWKWLQRIHPADLITDRMPFAQAPQAYQLLDQHPDTHLQMLFLYPSPLPS